MTRQRSVSGKALTRSLISVLGFEHGQLVEIGAQVDRLGMQQELGVLASLGQTAPEATT